MSIFSRALIVKIVVFISFPSYGLFDAVLEGMDKVAESSALIDATQELLKEVNPSKGNKTMDSIDQELEAFNKKLFILEEKLGTAHWAKSEIHELKRGPNFAHATLTESLQRTTQYLRRLKKLLATLAAFPKASVAYSQAETAISLNEQIKLQQASLVVQTQILNQLKLQAAKENLEKKAFDDLMTKEFKKRRGINP